jgi:Rieske Fe-S protein
MNAIDTSRRKFFKDACGACLGGAGLLLFASQAESCKAPAASTATAGVSKVISFPKSNLASVSSFVFNDKRLPTKVLVLKNADGTYKAISLKCTHLGVGLKEDGSGGLTCPAHGSKFDSNGKVTHGPAKAPLQIWTVRESGDDLIIES